MKSIKLFSKPERFARVPVVLHPCPRCPSRFLDAERRDEHMGRAHGLYWRN